MLERSEKDTGRVEQVKIENREGMILLIVFIASTLMIGGWPYIYILSAAIFHSLRPAGLWAASSDLNYYIFMQLKQFLINC